MSVRHAAALLVLATFVCAPAARANWGSDPTVNLPVCTAPGNQSRSDILEDGYGGCWIAWTDGRVGDGVEDIYLQHVLAQGVVDPGWPAQGLPVCTVISAQLSPVLAPDGRGGLFVAWEDGRIGTNTDEYMHHILANGAKDPAWPDQGAVVSNDLTSQLLPSIVADGSGGAYVAFGSMETNNDILLQHMLASGVQDPRWPINGKRVSPVTGDQFNPQAIADGAGGVFVAWSDQRSGPEDVYVTRVLPDASLAPGWTVDGNPACTAAGKQQSNSLASDGAGGVFVSWYDLRSGTQGDVYAQHLRFDGSLDPAWPANGVGISVGPGDAINSCLIPDGSHGILACWYEKRGADFDMFAAHLRGDGTTDPGAPVNGYAICAAPGNQRQGLLHSFMTDGAGGGFVVWRDERSGVTTPDVYGMHVLPGGNADLALPVNGLGVSTASGNQGGPMLCPDGSGGFVACWVDNRNGTFDIFAQRVTAHGILPNVGVAQPGTGAIALGPANPNPASASARLRITVAERGDALEVFDAEGRRMRAIAVQGGAREVTWDLRDERGLPVAAGLYFLRLRGNELTRRLVVTR